MVLLYSILILIWFKVFVGIVVNYIKAFGKIKGTLISLFWPVSMLCIFFTMWDLGRDLED